MIKKSGSGNESLCLHLCPDDTGTIIPQRDAKEYAGASKLPRLLTAELEAAVLGQLPTMMRQPVMISKIVTQAPYEVTAILDDTLPDHITLLELAADPPLVWVNQREQIGL